MPFAVSVELPALSEDEFLGIASAVAGVAFISRNKKWQEYSWQE